MAEPHSRSEDGFSSPALHARLATRVVGRHLLHFQSATSTMEMARNLVTKGVPEGTVVIAEGQTGGRGRLGRQWIAPSGGNLYLSVVLYPGPPILPQLVMASSVAVCMAVEETTGLLTNIKWPNDVLVGPKKVAGILIESVREDGDVKYAVVGIGVNVNLDPGQSLAEVPWATSLAHETGRQVSRLALAAILLQNMDYLYDIARSGGSLVDIWRRRLSTLGRHISAQWGDHVQHGVAEDVDGEGNLLLRSSTGELVRLAGGEVTLGHTPGEK